MGSQEEDDDGGHLDVCSKCGYERPSYNSCRNRHCPKCQCLEQARWIARRQERVIPTKYFHVVFTLPEPLRAFARGLVQLLFAGTAFSGQVPRTPPDGPSSRLVRSCLPANTISWADPSRARQDRATNSRTSMPMSRAMARRRAGEMSRPWWNGTVVTRPSGCRYWQCEPRWRT